MARWRGQHVDRIDVLGGEFGQGGGDLSDLEMVGEYLRSGDVEVADPHDFDEIEALQRADVVARHVAGAYDCNAQLCGNV